MQITQVDIGRVSIQEEPSQEGSTPGIVNAVTILAQSSFAQKDTLAARPESIAKDIFSLEALLPELKDWVLKLLDLKELGCMSHVNKFWRDYLRGNTTVWRDVAQRLEITLPQDQWNTPYAVVKHHIIECERRMFMRLHFQTWNIVHDLVGEEMRDIVKMFPTIEGAKRLSIINFWLQAQLFKEKNGAPREVQDILSKNPTRDHNKKLRIWMHAASICSVWLALGKRIGRAPFFDEDATINDVCAWSYKFPRWFKENETRLMELKSLNLTDKCLTTLPTELGNLSKLETLDLEQNKLSMLPAEFWKLSRLKRLNLSTNLLTILPPEIGNLVELEWISLDANYQLTSLPAEIENLTKLKYLQLCRPMQSLLLTERWQKLFKAREVRISFD